MEQVWNATIWGVRGSMPMACADYLEYGGNTSCVSVDCGEGIVVFDAGTGLIAFGNWLRSSGKKRVDLFFSHVHLDHIMGLPVFSALHDPGMELHFYGETRGGVSFRKQLETMLGPPYWPVGFGDFRARIEVHEIGPGERVVLPGGAAVSTLRGNHPNTCLHYRMEDEGRSLVYALDCETDEETFRRLARFAQGTDLLIWDACYAPDELAARRGWGHSSWEQGAALAGEAGVRLALMTHYANGYTDAFLREQERLAGDAVRFAREGMEIRL